MMIRRTRILLIAAAANAAALLHVSASSFDPFSVDSLLSAAEQPRVYSSKDSGDRAKALTEYGTAASFYHQYRTEAAEAGDRNAEKDALACELDACISANLSEQAQKLLDEYKSLYADTAGSSISLWQAEIFLIQRNIDKADAILKVLLDKIAKSDPVRLSALRCAALVAERRNQAQTAADIYGEIAASSGLKTVLGRRAAERQVLALGSIKRYTDALKILASLPVASSARDVDAMKILRFYLTLKEKGLPGVGDGWNAVREVETPFKDDLFYLVASRISEEYVALKEYRKAIEAGRLACEFATVREDAMEAVHNLIYISLQLKDTEYAAVLSEQLLTIFKDSYLSPDQKLELAEVFFKDHRSSQALELCINALESDADNKESTYRKALALAMAVSDFDSARALIQAYDTVPENTPLRDLDRAMVLCNEKKYDDALVLYRKMIDGGSLSGEVFRRAFSGAVECFGKLNRKTEALEWGKQLRSRKKDDDTVLLFVALMEEQNGNLKAALDDYKEYAENSKAPQCAEALLSAGKLAIRLGNNEEAEKILSRLLNDFPESPLFEESSYWLVYSLCAAGKDVAAELQAWSFYRSHPKSQYSCEALLKVARFYAGSDSQSHAIEPLTRLCEQGDFPEIRMKALSLSVKLYLRQEDTDRAESALSLLLQSTDDPERLAEAAFLSGEIARSRNDFKIAAERYAKAAELAKGTVMEQAAQGAIADCIFAMASYRPSVQEKSPSDSSEQTDASSLIPSYRQALEAYLNLLDVRDLVPEFRAAALYKAAVSAELNNDDEQAVQLLKRLIALLSARDAALHPTETFWIARGALRFENLAHKDPTLERVQAVIPALIWLNNAGIISSETASQRINALRKKQYQPLTQEFAKP